MSKQPAAFLGHGNPMNALEHNRYTNAWRSLADSAPKPRAVLMISAHWYVSNTAVTAMAIPPTIHDFYGFPPELFVVEYPAPGDPALAQRIAEALAPARVDLDGTSWGLDHGTWSVLVHMFPEADVPVVQLSLDADRPFAEHLEIGAALAPLREEGVMILGSGNVVHNLSQIEWSKPAHGSTWAHRFDEAVRAQMTTDPAELEQILAHPDFDLAVPTPEHFLPLAYLAGLAREAGVPASTLVEGCELGSLSMTSYQILD